ncbi:MAG: NAD(+) synthase [Clostridia bacterium]|nr:NAD(+) synthase [Clostridia bacterium]
MKFGFIKVGAFTPKIRVTDTEFNANSIIEGIELANKNGVEVLVFPELSITGKTVGDLFFNDLVLDGALLGLEKIAKSTTDVETLVFVGLPIKNNGKVFSACAVISKGEILAIIPKSHVERGDCFSSGENCLSTVKIMDREIPFANKIILADKVNKKFKVGVEIGSDIFAPITPSQILSQLGANLIVNLASFTCNLREEKEIYETVKNLSKRLSIGYVIANSGDGESTTDAVYSGYNLIGENEEILAESLPFDNGLITAEIDLDNLDFLKSQKLISQLDSDCIEVEFSINRENDVKRVYDKYPFIPKEKGSYKRILEIQAEGLKKRVIHTNAKKLVLGLSGGLDSTLALLVCDLVMKKLGRSSKDILAITMPCFGTTSRTLENSIKLAKTLGVSLKKINITKSVVRHLKDIGHSGEKYDAAYENAQARERTQVLMDIANMEGGLVVGTGDMSELALGWATYNGDHMSMYGVNAGVTKTLVKHLVREYALNSKLKLRTILLDVLDTPVSPELIPTDQNDSKQKTEDIVGPYALHDFFLYHLVFNGASVEKTFAIAKNTFDGEFDEQTIKKWLEVFVRRFFSQQFKRSCLPDGVAVDKYSLSPRTGFKMPSDVQNALWRK